MKIGITGATGFIGRHLVQRLNERANDCVAFSRSVKRPVPGCVETRPLGPSSVPELGGLDAVVNLAGESIIGRWTDGKKWRIRESRVRTTDGLVEAMGKAPRAPRLLVNASAIGIYGDRGDETLDETKPPGTGFLADVARDWEAAALGADRHGVRTALVRFGLVMGADGGAFPPLRRAFSLGLGGRLGSGQQWMSPVHVEDVVGLIVHLLEDDDHNGPRAARGPFNAVCPEPVRNVDFTRAVGKAVGRPTVLPAPGFVLRGLMGEASHLLLDSIRVVPVRTRQAGYEFRFPNLGSILADLCRPKDGDKD